MQIEALSALHCLCDKCLLFSIFILATKGACELCKEMAKVGADGVLVMPPFYFKKRMTVSL